MDALRSFILKRKLQVIIVGMVMLFLLARFILLQQPQTELTYTVHQEDLVDTVEVSGVYTTASQTQVFSPTNGIITNLYVANGDTVSKGEKLAYIQSTATTDQQKSAYAAYTLAESNLQTAENTKQSLDAVMWTKQQAYLAAQNNENYKTDNSINPSTKQAYTDLEKQQIDSAVVQTQKDFAASEQAYTTADVGVTATSAALASAQQTYQETQSSTITAPIGGTIANLEEQLGDQINALPPPSDDNTSGSQPLLVIANFHDPYITANISEDYAAQVQTSQKASIVFDADKLHTYSGTVQSIASIGAQAGGVTTFASRIALTQRQPMQIKPGMTALITIETLRKNNVMDVPNSAIVYKNGIAYLMRAQSHVLIPVQIGTKGTTKTEITHGLQGGEVILADPSGI